MRSSCTEPIFDHIDISSSSKSAFFKATKSRLPVEFVSPVSVSVSGTLSPISPDVSDVLKSVLSNVTAYPLTYPDVSLVFILYIPNSVLAPIITALVCSFKSLCCSANLVFL